MYTWEPAAALGAWIWNIVWAWKFWRFAQFTAVQNTQSAIMKTWNFPIIFFRWDSDYDHLRSDYFAAYGGDDYSQDTGLVPKDSGAHQDSKSEVNSTHGDLK
jgi:hypothetical protein